MSGEVFVKTAIAKARNESLSDQTRPLTLRERNKLDKRNRIRKSARRLFLRKGFDRATTREIAEQAEVGLATLFLYASDKRDLLFLIFNEELDELATTAFSDLSADLSFLDQLLAAFRQFYAYFGIEPELSRSLLKELTFYTTGMQSERFQQSRAHTLAKLSELVSRAKLQKRITCKVNNDLIARAIFNIYACEIRRWLSHDRPKTERGIEELRQQFRLLIEGLCPKERAT